jgi:hypothetical protein
MRVAVDEGLHAVECKGNVVVQTCIKHKYCLNGAQLKLDVCLSEP